MNIRALLPLLTLALAGRCCQAAVFAWVDPVSGMTVLSNVQAAKAAKAAGPAVPASASATAPLTGPADFPRVSGERQKQRDGMRRDILQAELGGERQALAAASSRGAAADIVQRHLANVEALKRELAGTR